MTYILIRLIERGVTNLLIGKIQMNGTESPNPTKKRIRGNAIDRLVKASARKVRDQSELIADALVTRVIAGDVNCAKLLVTLIEKLPPPKRKHRSMALECLKSGPWQDPAATGSPSADENEDEESKRLDALLGDEFVRELEKYRQAEREIARKIPASGA